MLKPNITMLKIKLFKSEIGSIAASSPPVMPSPMLALGRRFQKLVLFTGSALILLILWRLQPEKAWKAAGLFRTQVKPDCTASTRRDSAKKSYTLPRRFPFPTIRLVMESVAGSCDFYKSKTFCTSVQAGHNFEPEIHVVEVISSFLLGCEREICSAIDMGANQGWMSAYMLSLGAHVVSVEPQADLMDALRESVKLNCWEKRSDVVTGAISAQNLTTGFLKIKKPLRLGGVPSGLSLPDAPFVSLDSILERSMRVQQPIKLIKMDADGPEGSWLKRIIELLSQGTVKIETLVVEGSGVTPQILHEMQRIHGYEVYLLNMHIDKRFLDARGVDVYQHFAPDDTLPDYLEELYAIRFMRMLYHFRPTMGLQDWEHFYSPPTFWRIFKPQFLFTRVNLLEPRFEHPVVTRSNATDQGAFLTDRRKSGYVPPDDGIGPFRSRFWLQVKI